ncbi:DNA-3-methyladenine glycosylase 2 family protein [Nocardioides sp. zg-536]|uniref:DNA-3-methyladenine glycosylase 2 family protein n=1 Tax=Nocardioides faecalis TaxID=2803858 RepID=A0A938Y9H0_9ACTN|nr:DNA-3-methyladenine glycosylase 2 family protein [Nocardioides faecalis]MBM9460598.1 DNA-3-methyladenine glycosylase 2 family protein [Nocardioides faecalis]MBS4754340.1 DNA-3-methyladenine glycosylase 2 family protein [Nocardioides faecalis]QVI57477.1 DNA-3-methyladenine glycosylase 2 family protein [Nocardioides faecalis]
MHSRYDERVWRPGRVVETAAVLRQQRRGAGDPTHRLAVAGWHWRASRTPLGPVTLAVGDQRPDGSVLARAWGPGAQWALEQLPELLGEADDWSGFSPRHPVLAEARRRRPHLRLGRTARVLEALVPSIIEQKVTGAEAFAGFRALVHRHGEPAPGPGAEHGLMLPPDAATLRAIPSWEWLALHIDPARSRAVVTAARHADALERLAGLGGEEADRALCSLPGIGVWTSAEVRQRALGDPDAVSFGDYHVAKDVGWMLTGTELDDAGLAAYLEPWRPQRGRVPFLLLAAGLRRPRHGPRMAPRRHLGVRGARG